VKVHTFTYSDVLADSKLKDIIYSIEPSHRHPLACHLYRRSHTTQKCWWFIQILTPITRLPRALLHQILLFIIDEASHSPLALMLVCKHWYAIVTGIWASPKLDTTTLKDIVTTKLERNQRFLDVLVDTEIDRGHFTPAEGAYQAIFAAIEATSRWRGLVVETFPAQDDLPEDLVSRGLQRYSDPVMNHLRTSRIKYPCEMSPLLEHLLRILVTAANGELTAIEINSPSVISFLAPTYPSIFHSVTVLCLHTPGLLDPVDLLPHLHRLEALTASHLTFPIYHNDVKIPFVHTPRHLTLRAVSIQWMSGGSFRVLESCTILLPRRHQVLHTFSTCTTLPNCRHLTFQGYALDVLHGVPAHNLTRLSVMSPFSYEPRGSRQLVRFSSQALRESRLVSRILHISIEAMSWAWTKAFASMPNLEELVIESARPSSCGVKVLKSLVVHPVDANDLGISATHGGRNTPVCPSVKRLGLRYRHWLRPSEHLDLIPVFISIIWSRQRPEFSLKSLSIWKWSEQKEPLKLIEGSWISLTGFKQLSKDDAFKKTVCEIWWLVDQWETCLSLIPYPRIWIEARALRACRRRVQRGAQRRVHPASHHEGYRSSI